MKTSTGGTETRTLRLDLAADAGAIRSRKRGDPGLGVRRAVPELQTQLVIVVDVMRAVGRGRLDPVGVVRLGRVQVGRDRRRSEHHRHQEQTEGLPDR